VRSWVDDITSSWNFRQIIPCHFSAPIKAGPAEFKRAFTFAYELLEKDGEEQQQEQQHSQQQEGVQVSYHGVSTTWRGTSTRDLRSLKAPDPRVADMLPPAWMLNTPHCTGLRTTFTSSTIKEVFMCCIVHTMAR
jgi:hypothetical protein